MEPQPEKMEPQPGLLTVVFSYNSSNSEKSDGGRSNWLSRSTSGSEQTRTQSASGRRIGCKRPW